MNNEKTHNYIKKNSIQLRLIYVYVIHFHYLEDKLKPVPTRYYSILPVDGKIAAFLNK